MKKKKLRMFKVGVRRAGIARAVVASLHRRGIRAGRRGKWVFVEAVGPVAAKEQIAREEVQLQ